MNVSLSSSGRLSANPFHDSISWVRISSFGKRLIMRLNLLTATVQKKLRVIVDWFIDLFFKRDVTRLKTFTEEKFMNSSVNQATIQPASEN